MMNLSINSIEGPRFRKTQEPQKLVMPVERIFIFPKPTVILPMSDQKQRESEAGERVIRSEEHSCLQFWMPPETQKHAETVRKRERRRVPIEMRIFLHELLHGLKIGFLEE